MLERLRVDSRVSGRAAGRFDGRGTCGGRLGRDRVAGRRHAAVRRGRPLRCRSLCRRTLCDRSLCCRLRRGRGPFRAASAGHRSCRGHERGKGLLKGAEVRLRQVDLVAVAVQRERQRRHGVRAVDVINEPSHDVPRQERSYPAKWQTLPTVRHAVVHVRAGAGTTSAFWWSAAIIPL